MIQPNRGFTLVEILIAMFIFTIVSIIMASVMHSVLNTQASMDKQSVRFSELQIAELLLSRDISQVIDRPVTSQNGAVEDALLGSSESMVLTHGGLHNPNAEFVRSTLQRTDYHLEKGALIRQSFDVLDQAQKTMPSQRILLSDVIDIRFEYLNDQHVFENHWPPKEQTKAQLPRAVRVTLTIKRLGKISQLYVIPVTT